MVNDDYLDTKKALEKRLEALDLERDMLKSALESLNKAKYKYGDFVYTKDKQKGYITGVYSVNLIMYSIRHMQDRSPLTDLKSAKIPEDLTVETFLDSSDKNQIFYLCKIFDSKGDRYNTLSDIIVKQEDIVPYTEKAKILYDK